ncbi:MAG: hypothetical protein ACLR56_08665 [Oscillospiraceae bacterium]
MVPVPVARHIRLSGLERFLKLKCAKELGLTALDPARPYFIQFKMKATREEFLRF